jgi:hypothetical protein
MFTIDYFNVPCCYVRPMIFIRRYWVLAIGLLSLIAGVLIRWLTPQSYFVWSANKNPRVPLWLAFCWASWPWFVAVGVALIAAWIGYRIGRRTRKVDLLG